jgi:hypothetical protein
LVGSPGRSDSFSATWQDGGKGVRVLGLRSHGYLNENAKRGHV